MKKKTIYICENCGYESIGYYGKCPECGAWNSMKESLQEEKRGSRALESRKDVQRLRDIVSTNSDRISSSIGEFNRVMGGGIVRDSITILTAKPGAGKSTLLLQVANDLAIKDFRVLYASGEESESQIKNRADRVIDKIHPNVWVVSDNSMDNILDLVNKIDPDLIIIDSIQTFTLAGYPNSRAGSPTQTMECASELVKIAKGSDRPRAVMMIGQMTKEDEIAGVRALEHLVDAVLIIDGESGEELRTLLTTKNRYGSTGEMGFFYITDKGMISIDNPSEYFMTAREENTIMPGSSITVVREGTRPIILEIESLVSDSFTPFPSRIGESMRREQLNTLVSIIEQRGGISFFDKNVVIKTTGGIKLKEQASNLAVVMSIISSAKQIGIENDTVFIADVGLTGELKRVPSLEARIRELDRMGFKKVYVAPNSGKNIKTNGLKIVEKDTLKDVIRDVFK
ncbi:MAG: DNA repair protein RadA [Tissierellaceae bacterium]